MHIYIYACIWIYFVIYVLSYTEIITLFNYYFGIFVHYRQQLYGRNAISVEVKSYFYLLVTEVLNPFYIFQIASIVLWSFDNYILYATCIFLVSCLSVAVSLYETRKVSNLWLVLVVFLFFLYCILGFFPIVCAEDFCLMMMWFIFQSDDGGKVMHIQVKQKY